MTQSLKDLSYLSQVRRLRLLALEALKRYPIRARRMEFINHGENTTFCVHSEDGRKYLLRVHREGYHTALAIEEELQWLTHLSQHGFSVPKVIASRQGNVLESVVHPGVLGPRNCCMFEWVHGRFIGKSVSVKHLQAVGRLLAGFQNSLYTVPVRHRIYWDASGMLGDDPKFGSIDALDGASPTEQDLITSTRHSLLQKLAAYQTRFPARMGMIHADLHFGNMVNTASGPGAIDFDDCGFGFYIYDLAIPYLSSLKLIPKSRQDQLPEIQAQFKEALFLGYRSIKPMDSHDEELFDVLVMSRKLLMLGWLNSRSDNPDIKRHLKGAITRVLADIQNLAPDED
ncbi:MAG: phosphotransferase [Candidatus Cloacimonetes bacterium]|nr:phosphotransferase [Candidatus Cloacimonadota bacterium]